MTDDEYKSKMKIIVSAVTSFVMQTSIISENDLQIMQESISQADAIGFLFIPPVDLLKTNESISRQKQLTDLLSKFRSDVLEIFPEDEVLKSMIKGKIQ